MRIKISELHFAIRTIEARVEWIVDNKNDSSEEEGELDNLESLLDKLNKCGFELKEASQKT